MDWEAEGLLDGVEDEARAARAQLLDELTEQGVAIEELRAAVAEDRLALLPVERALLGEPKYTAHEVAELSGIPLERLLEIRRAIGIPVMDPDAASLTEEDLLNAKRTKEFLEAGLPFDSLLGVMRVLGDSMSRSAEAIRSMFGRAYLQRGDTERDVGERYTAMTNVLLPMVTPALDYMLRAHLREFTRHDAIGVAERFAGSISDTSDVAVAFADLVGFTRLGEEIGVEELGEVATRLTGLARDRIAHPVRLVKTIGDAVMLISTEAKPLLDLMLELVDAVRAEGDLPALRAGIAWGPAAARFGDWYGSTVNVASRVAARARADSVLVTSDVREVLGDAKDGYDWSFAGEKKFKNVSTEVPVWRARRLSGS